MGVKLRNVKIEDAPKVTEVAKKCAPWVRNSVTGTYEFLARCFKRYFFILENGLFSIRRAELYLIKIRYNNII